MFRALTTLASIVALAVSAAPASAQVDVVGTAAATQLASQGIIMRDGGICDPRRMGC